MRSARARVWEQKLKNKGAIYGVCVCVCILWIESQKTINARACVYRHEGLYVFITWCEMCLLRFMDDHRDGMMKNASPKYHKYSQNKISSEQINRLQTLIRYISHVYIKRANIHRHSLWLALSTCISFEIRCMRSRLPMKNIDVIRLYRIQIYKLLRNGKKAVAKVGDTGN